MTKTLNHIIFFPPPKSEYFFRKKKHNPPLQVKWSFPNRHDITEILFKVALNTINQTNKHTVGAGVSFPFPKIAQTY
jgi:hypothetical protein